MLAVKNILITLALIILTHTASYSQDSDTTTGVSLKRRSYLRPSSSRISVEGNSGLQFNSQKQQQMIIRGNVTFTTYNLVLTNIEEEILTLEVKESDAILKRDTATLKEIWLRDFTMDENQNRVMISQNPLPFYASLSRSIESCNIVSSDKVYTSGRERSQEVKLKGKLEEPVERPFFHTWIRRNGVWKLAIKMHEPTTEK